MKSAQLWFNHVAVSTTGLQYDSGKRGCEFSKTELTGLQYSDTMTLQHLVKKGLKGNKFPLNFIHFIAIVSWPLEAKTWNDILNLWHQCLNWWSIRDVRVIAVWIFFWWKTNQILKAEHVYLVQCFILKEICGVLTKWLAVFSFWEIEKLSF